MESFPDARTELVGLVGHPVAHSLSPAFWNPALRDAGRNAVFLAFDVPPEGFAAFVHGMAGVARGFNVTIPHKLAAYQICTDRSEVAEATGAVNVLVLGPDEKIFGGNTDVHGVTQAIAALDVDARTALVLGAGGAARAAVHALNAQGIDVAVANRTDGRASALSERTVAWDDVRQAIGDFDLVVHTTSVGLDGRTTVLDVGALRTAAGKNLKAVLDVVYVPGETPLVHAARAAGIRAEDGLRMLVHQAAEAWRLLFGSAGPIDVMYAAAVQAAGRAAGGNQA